MASDRDEIIEKINLYALAVDAQRWDLFDSIFADQCDADYGPAARWTSCAQFKTDFAAFHAPFDSTQHMMMNHLVRVDGGRANAFTYGSWRLVRQAAPGNPLWDGTGWYDDELIRTRSGWRIAKRVCRVVWFTGNPFVNETIPGVKFELECQTLRREAALGRVSFLNAIF